MAAKNVVFETGTRLPSLEPLYRVILAWDFYRDVTDDKRAQLSREALILAKGLRNAEAYSSSSLQATSETVASGHAKGAGSEATESPPVTISPVPIRFSSEDEYISRFYPLFLLEVKQMIHRAKEMEMGSPELVVQLHAEPRNGFIILTLQKADNSEAVMYSNDLCLLYLNNDTSAPSSTGSDAKLPTEGTSVAQKKEGFVLPDDPKAPHTIHILGVVESSVRDQVTLKVSIPEVDVEDTASLTRLKAIAQCINTVGQQWCFLRVMGLSTVNREYQALMSFPDLLLKEDILLSGSDPVAEVVRSLESIKEQKRRVMSLPPNQKKIHLKRLLAMEKKRLRRLEFLRVVTEGKARETLEIPQQLQQSLDTLYNTSQQEALRDCLKASGITLIQGPPGTGKTTTIVGVLSVILNASVKRPILPHATYHDTQENDPDEPPTNGHSAMEDASTAGDQEAGTPMEDDWASGEPLQDELDGPETRPSGQQPLQNCSNANRRSKRPVTSSWMQAQPWIYNPSYVPWYDDVSLVAEDLELFIEKRAEHTDAVVELTNVHLDSQPRRILVCAPSNAAIDEILKRLTADPLKGGGILDSVGERYTPAVIRVGPNIHPDLTEYSLETRTNARIQTMGTTAFTARDAVKATLLSECAIVCCTLSICGSRELTTSGIEFDTVVVDEASQGVELSTLIPLRLGCRRLILVGDPKQLPATVFSRPALLQNYDQSLFQRLERAGHKVNMLSVQYRMHPRISAFPSRMFYDGQLTDAPGIEKFVQPPIPWYTIPLFRPVVFYALDSAEAAGDSASLVNVEEAMFVCQLIDLLGMICRCIPGFESTWHQKVAVISPYADQVRYVRKLLKALLQVGPHKPCPIDVNTVDGFQGREKDFVIFTAVRAQYMGESSSTGGTQEVDKKTNVGFLADLRRMNVALTRARCNLWVVGNGRYLVGNPEWARFWHYAENNDFQFHVNYAKIPKDGYLKRWLLHYLKRSPETRILLGTHAPSFVESLERDVQTLNQNATNTSGKDAAFPEASRYQEPEDTAMPRPETAPPHGAVVPNVIDEGDIDEALVAS